VPMGSSAIPDAVTSAEPTWRTASGDRAPALRRRADASGQLRNPAVCGRNGLCKLRTRMAQSAKADLARRQYWDHYFLSTPPATVPDPSGPAFLRFAAVTTAVPGTPRAAFDCAVLHRAVEALGRLKYPTISKPRTELSLSTFGALGRSPVAGSGVHHPKVVWPSQPGSPSPTSSCPRRGSPGFSPLAT